MVNRREQAVECLINRRRNCQFGKHWNLIQCVDAGHPASEVRARSPMWWSLYPKTMVQRPSPVKWAQALMCIEEMVSKISAYLNHSNPNKFVFEWLLLTWLTLWPWFFDQLWISFSWMNCFNCSMCLAPLLPVIIARICVLVGIWFKPILFIA